MPVAVAALIGFGTGFSGVAGGLSSITSGPNAAPASAQTGPTKLNRAVVALAKRQTSSAPSATTNRDGGGSSDGPTGPSTGTGTGTGTGAGTGTGTGTGTSGGSGGSSGTQVPTVSTPSLPDVSLPGGGGDTGGAVDGATNVVNGAVNNVLGGVNNTLNGLLGH